MKYTEKLNLPIYDTPETDLFKIQDWNNGNTKIEQAYDEMLSYNGSETLRVQKEQERVLNETNRINNETTRNSSETNRVTSENTRKQNELDRIQREQETSLREQDRITNENNRVSLESERISSESLRVTKEDERIKSETERISKESERQIKEQDRVSSEEVRKTNELARQSVYKEITDARKDFNGVTRDNLEERLSSDLSYVNNRFNNASLLEYEAKYISASKSYDGITKDLKIKGRTLNNIVRHETTVYSKSGSGSGLSVEKTTNGGKWVVLDNKIATYRTIRLNKKDMLKPSTTYTLIFNVAKDDFGVNKIMTLSGNSDSYQGQGVNVLYNGAYVVGRNIVKFTTHSDISAYTGIGFGFPSINISATVGAETIVEDIMLLEGDYTNENIPFFEGIKSVGEEGKFDVVSCGKNLFDKKKANIIGGNGLVKADYDYVTLTSIGDINHKWICVKLPTNKPYTITIDKRKTYPSYWDNQVAESDSPTLKVGATFRKLHRSNNSTSSVSVHKITTTMPYVYIHCGYDITWRDNKEELLNSLIIEEGTVQTSYENYKETRIPITLNAPLRNLPNGVKDEVDLENGKIIRRVGKAVFDGSSDEKWSLALDPWTKDGIYCFDIQIQNEGVGDRWNALSKMTISDKFQSLSYSEGQTNLTGCLQYTNKGMKVALKQTFATTISDLRAWLQANPTTVYYELATPIEEAITLPNNLRIYDNVTNIYTEGSLIEPNVYCKIPSDVQAIVSELRVENENLRTLTTEQDSAIDTNLLATDEIYRALSPILNISEISDDNDNNKFIDLYKLMMKRNLIEHKDIPIEYQK